MTQRNKTETFCEQKKKNKIVSNNYPKKELSKAIIHSPTLHSTGNITAKSNITLKHLVKL